MVIICILRFKQKAHRRLINVFYVRNAIFNNTCFIRVGILDSVFFQYFLVVSAVSELDILVGMVGKVVSVFTKRVKWPPLITAPEEKFIEVLFVLAAAVPIVVFFV